MLNLRSLRRAVPLVAGLVLLGVFALAALWPELFSEYGRKEMFGPWLDAGPGHVLGTNALGYDIYTELVYGARETLVVGLCSSVLSLAIGTVVGGLSALRGPVGTVFNGLINVFALLPHLVTLIVLSAFFGSSTASLIVLIAVFGWVGTARAVRSKVMHLMGQPFIEACVVQGFSRPHILLHHVLSNLSDVLMARFLLGVNSCIMMESTLSFLGFGDLYHPTWGTMINFAFKRGAFLREAYAYLLAPGLCIMVLSLAFYAVGRYFEEKKDVISEEGAVVHA